MLDFASVKRGSQVPPAPGAQRNVNTKTGQDEIFAMSSTREWGLTGVGYGTKTMSYWRRTLTAEEQLVPERLRR